MGDAPDECRCGIHYAHPGYGYAGKGNTGDKRGRGSLGNWPIHLSCERVSADAQDNRSGLWKGLSLPVNMHLLRSTSSILAPSRAWVPC